MADDNDTDIANRWTSLLDEEVTVERIRELLEPVVDDVWVGAACVDRVVDEVVVERALLELGMRRTEEGGRRVLDWFGGLVLEEGGGGGGGGGEGGGEREGGEGGGKGQEKMEAYFVTHEEDATLCHIRATLAKRLRRLETYEELLKAFPASSASEEGEKDEWEDDDDPWDTDNINAEAGPSTFNSTAEDVSFSQLLLLLPLSLFLTEDIGSSCLFLASRSLFKALLIVRERHPEEYNPARLEILSNIPLFADPADYRDLLPAVDPKTGVEIIGTTGTTTTKSKRRISQDFFELSAELEEALSRYRKARSRDEDEQENIEAPGGVSGSLSSERILDWYKERIDVILLTTGIADNALSLVQHGIAHGVLGLDEVGEDLSLISRLVYDAHNEESDVPPISTVKWSLLSPKGIIDLYVERSTPDTIVSDIRRLVKPYLFVLESRCERAGKPDHGLSKRLLYDFILRTSLELVAPIFDASKPTMVASQRLVVDDEDLARLALACLYGSNSATDWSSMSRIFECLPAWNFQTTEAEDEADTTISSLRSFLVPTTARPQTDPSDLIAFFKPLPARSLSRALDILDVHLESGEILARWGVAVPLRWFLRSSKDEVQQRAWAARMARQADAPQGDLNSENIWLSLLEDMLKLCKPDEEDTNSAFGALSSDEIRKIFFKGILSTGKFDIAKSIVLPRHGERLLQPDVVETLCLEVSREFYDNAESGNYHTGSMKLAYDCLSVSSQTPLIAKERDFIEATSRISSFNVSSGPGLPLLPIEIRLTKDRLSLVQSILRSNASAYKHSEVLLELVAKLGFKNDLLAEAKTLAMVGTRAMQAGDEERAVAACERMVNAVVRLKQKKGIEDEKVKEGVKTCWSCCYEIVKHLEESQEIGTSPSSHADATSLKPGGRVGVEEDRKMSLLARSLEFCPPEAIADVLPHWSTLESHQLHRRKSILTDRRTRRSNPGGRHDRGRDPHHHLTSLSSKLHDTVTSIPIPSPTLTSASTLASSTFNRVAAVLPFGMHAPSTGGSARGNASATATTPSSTYGPSSARPGSAMSSRFGAQEERSRSRSPDVSSHARTALRRGVGWLIGADEQEMAETI